MLSSTDENDIALVPLNSSKSRANNLHHSHIFQHQSSVSSTASIQTVFHQSVYQSINNDNNTTIAATPIPTPIPTTTASSAATDEVDSIINNYNITAASNNQMILLGTSSSAASFQSANGNLNATPTPNVNANTNGNGYNQQMINSISTPNPQQQLQLHHQQKYEQYGHTGSINSLNSSRNNAMYQQQLLHSSDVSIGDESLSIGDVADLLHPQYAIITGGRSREGCPIITFPDHNNFHLLTEHDYEKLISYLTSVPP